MSEIEEVQNLIAQATFPGVKSHLQLYLNKLNESKPVVTEPSPKATISTATTTTSTTATASAPVSVSVPITSASAFIPITDFAWEQGAHNTSTLTVYVELKNVGSISKDNIQIHFGKHSIDLLVRDLDGKNYRLIKDNLEKDIIPAECKMLIKANRIVLKLQKVKGEYSYETWNNLSAKNPRDEEKEKDKKKDPMGGLMDMMKDMYEDGDENMKKIIGEAMLKSKTGDKSGPPSSSAL